MDDSRAKTHTCTFGCMDMVRTCTYMLGICSKLLHGPLQFYIMLDQMARSCAYIRFIKTFLYEEM